MFSKFDRFYTHKRSRRLKGFNYSDPAAYFVTMRLQTDLLFGDVTDGKMRLNEFGRIVRQEWLRSESVRDEVCLDEYIVMPDHLHGIVVISPQEVLRKPEGYELLPESFRGCVASTGGSTPQSPTQPNGPQPRSLSAFAAGFKAATTKRINRLRRTPGDQMWQRSFHDHIIRDEREWRAIRRYIRLNPAWWKANGFDRNRG